MKSNTISDLIEQELGDLWASKIISYDFNIFSATISFTLEICEYDKKTIHQLSFVGVKNFSHFGLVNHGEDDEMNDIESYLELTSVEYYKNGAGKINLKSVNEKWLVKLIQKYNFIPNISIEIWDAMVLIEADKVIINNKEYTL